MSCSGNDTVTGYFRDHGFTYPVDTSGLGILGVEYAGIEDEEITAEGARDFVESGIGYIRDHFNRLKADAVIKGAEAVTVEEPVLYRNEKGDIGIMVKITAYGTGDPEEEVKNKHDRFSSGKGMWRAQNFAYFFRNELYQWQFGGMVY